MKVALCAAILSSNVAIAAPGDLDITFNASGSLPGTLVDGRLAGYSPAATRIQADGKIVSLGTYDFSANNVRFGLFRHLVDGTPDSTFGSGGVNNVALTTFQVDRAKDLAIQPDGRIIAAGHCQINLPGPPQPTASDDFCLARFLANGQLDSSFGTNGIVLTAIGPDDDRLSAIALQSDGKIVATGYCESNAIDALSVDQACLVRYLSDGSLDTTFGVGGKVVQPISAGETITSIALQENGKILIAGSCVDVSTLVGCVARFTSTGALDPTFSGNGIRYVSFSATTLSPQFVAVQPDGKIIVGGDCGADFCLARLNANGTFASTLSGNGRLIAQIGTSSDNARSFALQPDGRLLVAGYCTKNSRFAFCTARFLDNGEFDTDFGVGGVVITELQTPVNTEDVAHSIALQRDGKLIVSGRCQDDTDPILPRSRFCMARYLGGPDTARNCSLDIDGDGKILATTDLLIVNRAAAGLPTASITNGVVFASNALRTTPTQIRDYLVRQCGMSIVP